jgi:hypothetical protein
MHVAEAVREHFCAGAGWMLTAGTDACGCNPCRWCGVVIRLAEVCHQCAAELLTKCQKLKLPAKGGKS